jgi:hypothetical protein
MTVPVEGDPPLTLVGFSASEDSAEELGVDDTMPAQE